MKSAVVLPHSCGAGGMTPPIDPLSKKTKSGSVPTPQVATRAPKFVQGVPKPPPGFLQADSEFDCTVRSFHPHWPFGVKSIRA